MEVVPAADELLRALECAKACAVRAGALVRAVLATSKSTTSTTTHDKNSTGIPSIDLVTETDRQCEELILAGLAHDFPDYAFLGEETASAEGQYHLTDSPTWVVDPIDGTTNFVHRSPEVAVSIALSVNKEPVLGVVLCLAVAPGNEAAVRENGGELFTAIRGGGAYLNGVKISVDSSPGLVAGPVLNHAVVCTNIGYGRDKSFIAHVTGTIENLMSNNLRGLRMSGAACHSMVSVACGRTSAFFEAGPHPWDVAAAAVIVREAGGVALDMTGGPLDLCSRRYLLASTAGLAEAIVSSIADPLPFK